MGYIHLGENQMIPMEELIAIINIEDKMMPDTADFKDQAEASKHFYPVSQTMPAKSLVIGARGVYESPISSATLYRRALNKIWEEKNE